MSSEPTSSRSPQAFFRRRGEQELGAERAGSGLVARVVPGQVLGDFRLDRPLGSGAMGQVWEAWQISLGRKVALKLLSSGGLLSEMALAMFEREARAGGRLHHPSIVSVLAYGEADGLPFIAQELVGGRPPPPRRVPPAGPRAARRRRWMASRWWATTPRATPSTTRRWGLG